MQGEETSWEGFIELHPNDWTSFLSQMLPSTPAQFDSYGADAGLLRRARMILVTRGMA